MKIWVILWSDGGYECTNVFVEAYDSYEKANERASELQMREKSDISGYSVEEYDLNSRVYK